MMNNLKIGDLLKYVKNYNGFSAKVQLGDILAY